jgi:hypothetical protein
LESVGCLRSGDFVAEGYLDHIRRKRKWDVLIYDLGVQRNGLVYASQHLNLAPETRAVPGVTCDFRRLSEISRDLASLNPENSVSRVDASGLAHSQNDAIDLKRILANAAHWPDDLLYPLAHTA